MFVDLQESEHCEGLPVLVDFVVADLPYTITLVEGKENSNHDIFASADMKAMSSLWWDAMAWNTRNNFFHRIPVWPVVNGSFQGS